MQNFSYLLQGKRFQIGSWMDSHISKTLLLITNRKWHTPCQIKWKSLTLDDLEGHWQQVRSAILATPWLLVSYKAVRRCAWFLVDMICCRILSIFLTLLFLPFSVIFCYVSLYCACGRCCCNGEMKFSIQCKCVTRIGLCNEDAVSYVASIYTVSQKKW